MHDYAPSSYDNYLCLKPSLLLWMIMAYLSRAILLPLLAGVGAYTGAASDSFSAFRGAVSVETFAPSAIAALVIFAACRRTPAASTAMRWIWAHGRLFLAASACLDLLLSLTPAIRHWEPNYPTLAVLYGSAIDAYVLLFILCARRVRDTFAGFPPPLEPEPTRSAPR